MIFPYYSDHKRPVHHGTMDFAIPEQLNQYRSGFDQGAHSILPRARSVQATEKKVRPDSHIKDAPTVSFKPLVIP
jgi:hypothetical protein